MLKVCCTRAQDGVNLQQIYEAGPAFERLIDHKSWFERAKFFINRSAPARGHRRAAAAAAADCRRLGRPPPASTGTGFDTVHGPVRRPATPCLPRHRPRPRGPPCAVILKGLTRSPIVAQVFIDENMANLRGPGAAWASTSCHGAVELS
jgi:hypothetical protein